MLARVRVMGSRPIPRPTPTKDFPNTGGLFPGLGNHLGRRCWQAEQLAFHLDGPMSIRDEATIQLISFLLDRVPTQ